MPTERRLSRSESTHLRDEADEASQGKQETNGVERAKAHK